MAQLLASIFWGTAAPIVKLALQEIHPSTFIFLRMTLSLIILFPILLPRLKKSRIKFQDLPMVIVCGFLGITINIGAYFLGLSKTTVIDSSVIMATTSIFTSIAAYLFLKEKINRNIIIGTLLSLGGILIIMFQSIVENGFLKFENLIGNLIIFVAMLGWVAYTILNKEIAKKYDTLVLIYYSFIIGAISFLPFAFKDIVNPVFYQNLTPFLIFAILFETIFATIGSYLLFVWGIKYISASAAGVISYVNPIAAILISVLLLNEKITMPFVIGALFIILGIFFVEIKKHQKRR